MLKKAFILPEIALHRTLEACRASAQGRSAGAGNAERGGGPSEHPRSGRGKRSILYCNILPSDTEIPPAVRTARHGAGGGRKGGGRNRCSPWGVQTKGRFFSANQFGEGRGEGISVTCCLTSWLARALNNYHLGQNVRFAEYWSCLAGLSPTSKISTI